MQERHEGPGEEAKEKKWEDVSIYIKAARVLNMQHSKGPRLQTNLLASSPK